MPNDADEQELRDVIAEEKSRGTGRHADPAARRKQAQLEKDTIRAIKAGDLHAYVRMLHEAGIKDGTPEFANALKIFHSFRGQR
jgi:hypothetical protein